jgi:hypothetical protein
VQSLTVVSDLHLCWASRRQWEALMSKYRKLFLIWLAITVLLVIVLANEWLPLP